MGKYSYRWIINTLFSATLIILILSTLFAYKQTETLIKTSRWVTHSHQVIDAVNHLILSYYQSRVTLNRYFISGQNNYLQELHLEINRSEHLIDEIRQLTSDNGVQQQKILQTKMLLDERNKQFSEALSSYSKNQKELAVKQLLSTPWVNLNNKIITSMRDLIDTEDFLLSQRTIAVKQSMGSSHFIFLISSVVSEAFLILCMVLLNYQLKRRHYVEREKSESDERLKLLIDYAILMLDTKGAVTTWNTGAEQISGYKAEEILAHHFSIFYPPEAVKAHRPEEILKIAREKARFEEQNWRIRKDGSKFWADVIVTPIFNENKNLIGYCKVTRDLSDQKHLESLKHEFVSIVSHELRTPLTSIRGALSLLQGGAVSNSPEKTENLLSIASTNCDRLVRLINDILDIEKIESGKMSFNIKFYNLSKLISEVVDINQMFAEKFGIKLLGPVIPPDLMLKVDSDRFIQVLTNLLSNAIKFSNHNATVLITTEIRNKKIRIAVINQGEGISEQFKAKIFEKFSQQDVSTSRQETGTGLGLAISQAILEKFGSELKFISIPMKETTFYFDLPIYYRPILNINQKKGDNFHRVLICEDDEEQAIYLSTLLQGAGYQTDVSYSAKQAIHLLEENTYYALLLDLILPDMSGIELIKQLRRSKLDHKISIIVVSIIANESKTLLEGNAIEVIDWLDKPLDFTKLIHALNMIGKHEKDQLKILHIEDDKEIQRLVKELLHDRSKVTATSTVKTTKRLLKSQRFDLAILDLLLPDGNGVDLIPLIAEQHIPILVFATGKLDPSYARYVSEVLIKSKTSPEKLLSTINKLLKYQSKAIKNE